MIASRTLRLPRERAAQWLSRLFHPFVVTIPTLVLAIYLAGASPLAALGWTALAVATVIAPMVLWIAVSVHAGRYSDWDVSIREQRHSIYLVGGGCLVALLAVLTLAGAPAIVATCIYAAIATTVVGAAINYRLTKVSLHAATMAGCTTVLLTLSAPLGVALGLAALAVGWSRMRLDHHTSAQVILGWIVGAACTLTVFRLYLSA